MSSDMRAGVVSIYGFAPLPAGKDQYPLEFVEANGVLKLREEDDSVIVGVCEDAAPAIADELRRHHRKPIELRRIDRRELAAYLGRRLSQAPTVEERRETDERLTLDRLANDAPIVNLVNSLLIEAIRHDASDLHIESYAARVSVRYRIDGVLRVVGSIPLAQFAAVSSRIKIMANLNIMERRLPQDGRLSVHLAGRPYDLRVSIVPVAHGESIVLRLFQKTGSVMRLDELGFTSDVVSSIRASLAHPHGLFLITGPTGSGKTTTLTAILQELQSVECKIVTIEDPVEYVVEGVNQIPTNDQIGLTFESLLRRVLRQDPDIIMVGEVRDRATAELAVRAALTGHLVLTTLHTNDAVSAVTRLRDMGIENYRIAGVLRAVLAQRLVRRVCPGCAEPATPTPAERCTFEKLGIANIGLRKGAGCEQCSGTGYRGRIALSELFIVDREIESMIAANAGVEDLSATLAARGSSTLLSDGHRKAAAGRTTIGEVEAAAS
ncbi:GspE/PulE family protein [Salinispira pacifica]